MLHHQDARAEHGERVDDRVRKRSWNVHEKRRPPEAAAELVPRRETHDERRQQRRHIPVNQIQNDDVNGQRVHVLALRCREQIRLNAGRNAEGCRDPDEEQQRDAARAHVVTIDAATCAGQGTRPSQACSLWVSSR